MQPQFPVDFNGYLIFILALMAASYLVDLVANALNASRLTPELPPEFQGIYDPGKYRTAIEYQKEGTRFEALQKTFWLLVTVLFIVAGGFNQLDLLCRSARLSPIPTGLIFVGALGLAKLLLGFPFSIYDTFVLEERYGFNRTTAKTFAADTLKACLLAVLIGAPVFAAIIWFFQATGSLAWLYAWIAFTAFQLLLSFLAPAVILPLFNRFDPLPEGELKTGIERFAQSQAFALRGIYRMDSSRRSTKSNAFFTGFGRFRRLVLFDTLIERQTPDELIAVLAHEIGHFKRKHVQKGVLLSILMSGALFYGVGFFLRSDGLFAAFGMEHKSVYAGLIFVGLLFSPVMTWISPLTRRLSRKHEFEADRYAVSSCGKPDELIAALKKLSIDNLSNLTPHPLKVWLDYTHPPILERIERIRSIRPGRGTAIENF